MNISSPQNSHNINNIHLNSEAHSYPKFTKLKWYPEPLLTLAEFYCVVRTEFDDDLDAAKKAYRFFFNSHGWNIDELIETETQALATLREYDPQNWKVDLVRWAASGLLENLAEVREMIWGHASYDPTDENSFNHQINKADRLQMLNELTSWKLCPGCHSELMAHLNEVDPDELTSDEPEQLQFAFMQDDPNDKN